MNTPERFGRVRIALVGASGCGKTALAHLLATGTVLRSPNLTVGGNVSVKIFRESQEEGSAQSKTEQTFFIELWDIGAQERYEALWPLFLSGLSGVILVYDAATARGSSTVPKWAEYVRQQGTFTAPLAEEQAAGNLCGLPVPYLVVANKSDLKGTRSGSVRLSLLLWQCARRLWQKMAARNKFGRLARTLSQSMSTSEHPDVQAESIPASALLGNVDRRKFDAFFAECIARRYRGGTPLRGFGREATVTESPSSLAPGGVVAPNASSSSYRGNRRHEIGDLRHPTGSNRASEAAQLDWSASGRIDDGDF